MRTFTSTTGLSATHHAGLVEKKRGDFRLKHRTPLVGDTRALEATGGIVLHQSHTHEFDQTIRVHFVECGKIRYTFQPALDDHAAVFGDRLTTTITASSILASFQVFGGSSSTVRTR